ncbi:HAD family hydrolase [Cellulosilyticum ruminicola]|uniref:HAD family hydrolase n=1 Tax=Cellulosilyticum ruminicola TaxID=425254 RepID=UPI0006CF6609|nr:HAD family hydrolase [Cellulosilyticum ruminicola]
MYQLAIFDLDGTLLDTIQDLCNACNHALAYFGYKTHDIEACKYFVGSGIYKLIERALPEEVRDEANVLKVKAVFDAYYAAHSEEYTKPYDGILEMLESLNAKGVKCAVLTNKAQVYAQELVDRQFKGLVEEVIGQREGIPSKPNPVGIYELLNTLNVAKENCIYIGDSDIDMYTAANAQVTSVGVLWGFRTKEELISADAKYLAKSPVELEVLILNR